MGVGHVRRLEDVSLGGKRRMLFFLKINVNAIEKRNKKSQ